MSDDDDFMCDDEEYDLVSLNNTKFYCHLNDTGTILRPASVVHIGNRLKLAIVL